MIESQEKRAVLIEIHRSIHTEIQGLNASLRERSNGLPVDDTVFVSFKASEIYLLLKSFVDAGGAPNDNYRSIIEKTVPKLSNRTQRGFSVESICKCSDKLNGESRETVKRFLQRMIRNIDSYD